MNQLKRYSVIGFIFVSILGTLSHFFYHWSGENPIVGLFSPVNESTWEHMKLLFFPASLYLVFIYSRLKSNYPNITSALSIGILIGTFLIPVIFYTYTWILGYNLLFLDIATFYLSVAVAFFITYKLSNSDKILPPGIIFTAMLIVLVVCFVMFTYLPPDIELFAVPA